MAGNKHLNIFLFFILVLVFVMSGCSFKQQEYKVKVGDYEDCCRRLRCPTFDSVCEVGDCNSGREYRTTELSFQKGCDSNVLQI